jgi:hypothetical protein
MGVQKFPDCRFGEEKCDMINYLLDNIAYWPLIQDHVSAGSYWRSTYSNDTFDFFKKYSNYLAYINNEVQHEKSE